MTTAAVAVFSLDRRYRYALRRRVGMDDSAVLFVMLNPSTADEEVNDPTIRRCIGFANRWGFGWLTVCNLFAYRATKPRDLWKSPDPIGLGNDFHILREARVANQVVVAWGEAAKWPHRIASVRCLLAGIPLYCLGTNGSGSPKHPLYVPKSQPLVRWEAAS